VNIDDEIANQVAGLGSESWDVFGDAITRLATIAGLPRPVLTFGGLGRHGGDDGATVALTADGALFVKWDRTGGSLRASLRPSGSAFFQAVAYPDRVFNALATLEVQRLADAPEWTIDFIGHVYAEAAGPGDTESWPVATYRKRIAAGLPRLVAAARGGVMGFITGVRSDLSTRSEQRDEMRPGRWQLDGLHLFIEPATLRITDTDAGYDLGVSHFARRYSNGKWACEISARFAELADARLVARALAEPSS
jgi:hypothetical protein